MRGSLFAGPLRLFRPATLGRGLAGRAASDADESLNVLAQNKPGVPNLVASQSLHRVGRREQHPDVLLRTAGDLRRLTNGAVEREVHVRPTVTACGLDDDADRCDPHSSKGAESYATRPESVARPLGAGAQTHPK